MHTKQFTYKSSGWFFGLIFFTIGIINTFWGNDPFYGIFVLLCSLFYFPPLNAIFERKTRFSIPLAVKIVPGLFILWTVIGVAELFDKTEMMMHDLF